MDFEQYREGRRLLLEALSLYCLDNGEMLGYFDQRASPTLPRGARLRNRLRTWIRQIFGTGFGPMRKWRMHDSDAQAGGSNCSMVSLRRNAPFDKIPS
jgi:hypothetical protein